MADLQVYVTASFGIAAAKKNSSCLVLATLVLTSLTLYEHVSFELPSFTLQAASTMPYDCSTQSEWGGDKTEYSNSLRKVIYCNKLLVKQ